MRNELYDFDQLRNNTIGNVESISPREIRILLELEAPQNTAINTGVPTLFPKINGFVIIPNESGGLVCIISWIGIEHSPYPKRKGLKDFDIIDLPFPLRKMSVNPLGILKKKNDGYEIERGVYSYPSVGDPVVIPSQLQLQAIVQNDSKNAKIKIGNSPLAANTPVYVDPDKLFGRHIAVLGNTGSGKSCSVAGLIRWSMESAKEKMKNGTDNPNARFIILDPNGEYTDTFDDIREGDNVRKFKVAFGDDETGFEQLRVPAWMWNSYEWSSIAQASARTQRPLLRRALRELRGGEFEISNDFRQLQIYYSSCLIEVKKDLNIGVSAFKGKPGKNEFGKKLKSISNDAKSDSDKPRNYLHKTKLIELSDSINSIVDAKYGTYNGIEYYSDFEKNEVESLINFINQFLMSIGGLIVYKGPDEDTPINFKDQLLPDHLERLSQEQNVQQFLDFLIMRIRTILADTRMNSIIGTIENETLKDWLEKYIGANKSSNGEIVVIDLSIVPTDIIHIVVSVISRLIFEALQRYRRKNSSVLPTVLVMEEAHNFISRYNHDNDDISPSRLCSQTFEKIAKEGRKFGLGLMLSSQRPSELSSTVLSQCNTFLLHRLVNDKDQELVRKFVPDNLGGILNELPILPTKKAVLLGWAAPIPLLVDMNHLKKEQRPNSKDPDYWDVWTGKEARDIKWDEIVQEWQVDSSPVSSKYKAQGEENTTESKETGNDEVPF